LANSLQPLNRLGGEAAGYIDHPQARLKGTEWRAAEVQARFNASYGTDPIFRLFDGATCPTDDVATLAAKREAYKVIDKVLIRIGLALPTPDKLQFEVTNVAEPYDCTTNPKTGLTSKTTGIVSVYRRPLPSTNLGFLSTIMWDGREPTLESQSVDATLTHAQANTAPTVAQQHQIVAFESGIFTAQNFDKEAHDLDALHTTAGPKALSQQLAKFFIGVNDPFEMNPTGAPFDSNIFDLYKYWQTLRGDSDETQERKSVARGEQVFNTIPIKIREWLA
jgi:cytochrome c peroxidase